jgi:hypothetical protein
LISCLDRKIFRNAKRRKMAEAPRLSTQLIAALPITANGLVNTIPSSDLLSAYFLSSSPARLRRPILSQKNRWKPAVFLPAFCCYMLYCCRPVLAYHSVSGLFFFKGKGPDQFKTFFRTLAFVLLLHNDFKENPHVCLCRRRV